MDVLVHQGPGDEEIHSIDWMGALWQRSHP